jgi:protein-L-isoaspartate(D-aspartate) O-methyltransferase
MIAELLGRNLASRLRSAPEIDPRVAEAMIAVERHRFVSWKLILRAYEDRSLPTGPTTSISQPTYVAKLVTHARIQRDDRVLEIGTGSGYTAAVLARLAREVVTVEHVPELAATARRRLATTPNISVVVGDGCHVVDGPFDAILVMAGAPLIPPCYGERLREGGRLIIPVGERLRGAIRATIRGSVFRVTRTDGELIREDLGPGDWNVLRGQDGWREE